MFKTNVGNTISQKLATISSFSTDPSGSDGSNKIYRGLVETGRQLCWIKRSADTFTYRLQNSIGFAKAVR